MSMRSDVSSAAIGKVIAPTRARREPWTIWRFDATSALSLFVWTFAYVPSQLVFAPLGSAGTPAQVIGVAAFFWWLVESVRLRSPVARATWGLHFAVLIYAAGIVVSYLAAVTRPIPAQELNGADRSLISLTAWCGVLLVAMDGIVSRDRLELLVRRIVTSGAVVAVLGVIQFLTHRLWVDRISIPGLSFNTDLEAVTRNGFSRPAGTATHPIEFSVVLAMCLALALHLAMQDRHRSVLRRWWPVVALAVACPLSLSRTTIVCLVVSVPIVVCAWTRTQRRAMYGATFVLLLGVYELVPGMLGTFLGLFTGISSDGSALSRADSVTYAFQYVARWPVFGRGYGTFLPEYRILDDMLLGILIGGGIVGLTATLIVIGTPIWSALRLRARTSDPRSRSLALSLVAMIVAGFSSFATFDSLAFPMVPCLLFLAIGLVGSIVANVEAGT